MANVGHIKKFVKKMKFLTVRLLRQLIRSSLIFVVGSPFLTSTHVACTTIEIFSNILEYVYDKQRENWLRMTNFHFSVDFIVRAFISSMVYVFHFKALGK